MSHHGDGVLVFALGKALLLYLVIELGVHLYWCFICVRLLCGLKDHLSELLYINSLLTAWNEFYVDFWIKFI